MIGRGPKKAMSIDVQEPTRQRGYHRKPQKSQSERSWNKRNGHAQAQTWLAAEGLNYSEEVTPAWRSSSCAISA
eukprot:1260658-Amphidinium_carterae.1